jgi:release factor glutamine methyltransferase
VTTGQDELVGRLRAAGCVFAEDEARLLRETAGSAGELAAMAERRIAGLPLEQVLGWAEFRGLRVAVDPGVFVPRTRTGYLVELALPLVAPGSVVVDVCCGSGAVGLALATERPGIELHATDLDPVAARCAAGNLAGLGSAYAGDLFAPLPGRLRGRVDVLVANAPYVPTGAIATMPPEARDHEPRLALDGGADGLDIHRRVAAAAGGWLAPGGVLLIETSVRQAPATAALLAGLGREPVVRRDEELDATVAVGGREPAEPDDR